MTLPSGYWRRSCRPHTYRTPLRCTGPAPPPHTCKPSSITSTPPYQPDIWSTGSPKRQGSSCTVTLFRQLPTTRLKSVPGLSASPTTTDCLRHSEPRPKSIARHPYLQEPALRLNLHSGLSGLGCLVLRLARGEPRVSTCEGRRGTRPLHADRHAPRRGLARGGVRHA